MRTVKPLRFSVLHRVFENAGQPILTVTGLAAFRFDAPKAIQHEVALWKAATKFLGETALDEAMPKTRGEVLVVGSAYVHGEPKPGTNIRVTVSRKDRTLVDKELVVIGDRHWTVTGMTTPESFNELPVTWGRAFGGEGFDANPIGRGFKPVEVDGHETHLLPNVESKKHLVKSAGDRPTPCGFGPLDVRTPERMKRVGTYDQEWLSTRFPYYPKDFDWEFFNVAPPDQRIEGFFDGSETFRVEGMHPSERVLEVQLPPLLARMFVIRRGEPDVLVEVGNKLDTVILLPSAGLAVAVFRGTIPVREDDAEDITHLVAGLDDRAAPRPVSHFMSVKEKREKKGEKHLYVLLDEDLLPDWFVDPDTTEEGWDDMSAHLKLEFRGMQRASKMKEELLATARQKLREAGMSDEDIDLKEAAFAPPARKVPQKLSELPEAIRESTAHLEAVKRDLEAKQVEQDAGARALLAARGIDLDEVKRANEKAAAGPPKVSVHEQVERLRDRVTLGKNAGIDMSELEAKLADPHFEADALLADQRQLEMYRRFGHMMPVAPDPLAPDANTAKLAELARRRDAGESLRGFDFTGVDLRDVDLVGADLGEALFECARFDGARLARANLAGAMLGRATLDGGDFTGASMKGTNLAKSTFCGAKLDGVDLTDANMFGATLDGGSFRGATIAGTLLMQTIFGTVDLSGAIVKRSFFVEADLSRSALVGLVADQLTFLKCTLDDVDLSKAKLERVSFIECRGARVRFKGATIDRMAFVSECELPAADFSGARLRQASLRGTVFTESDFTLADADECDFSGSDLSRAKLYHLKASRSLFVRTNLTGADVKGAVLIYAILQKAKIFGADFRGANLFRADLSKVKGDTATNFKDAYLVQITVAGSQEKPGGAHDA